MTLVKNLLADSHQLDADNSRNRENLHVDDILEFGRIILVVAGGLSLAIVVRVAAARIGLPTAALLLTVAALASDLSDRLATLLSFQDVQRVATLALIAILPEFLITGFKVAPIPFIGERLDAMLPRFVTEGMGVTFYFGGTTLLIIVGVAMDTIQQVESQLIMRHYDGFMKKTRIRGRRA